MHVWVKVERQSRDAHGRLYPAREVLDVTAAPRMEREGKMDADFTSLHLPRNAEYAHRCPHYR